MTDDAMRDPERSADATPPASSDLAGPDGPPSPTGGEIPPQAAGAIAAPADAATVVTQTPPDIDVGSEAIIDKDALAASEAAAIEHDATKTAIAVVAAVAAARAAAAAEPTEIPAAEEALLAAPRHPRFRLLRATLATVVRGLLVLALFLGGWALGQAAFARNDADAPTAFADPGTDGTIPPAVVQEFIAALAAGDADSLRSSLQAEPHSRLTSEFRRFDIQAITAVDTLGTHVDGTRSATEVVMQGTTTEGTPISINLIILADGNAIEGFR